MKKLLIFIFCLLFYGCQNHSFDGYNEKEIIKGNVEAVFGVSFPESQDWSTTVSGIYVVNPPAGTTKIQILAKIPDSIPYHVILNESDCSIRKLTYDAPKNNLGIVALYKTNDEQYIIDNITRNNRASSIVLPTGEFSITNTVESFASQRGWLPGQILYESSNEKISVSDYNDSFKSVFNIVIFSYLKDGRKYNNLPLIKKSGLYNENFYAITTGDEPIIISPVYKADGSPAYGCEVFNSDLYYYYFKESDLGDDPVAYINSLPKYKAVSFKDIWSWTKDDEAKLEKKYSYGLLYYGDGTPEIGTKGTFQFPKGYKIGFMVRAKTTAENGKKQGELYADGRLNNEINFYNKTNFKSSNLGTDGPRAGWVTFNNKLFLCWESGTDTDFNDIILEVEGGIEDIYNTPEIDYNYYTFCFEDTKFGDYDMNDVVIKGRRLSNTKVEYTLIACGAYDQLYIRNVEGKHINSNYEVHSILSSPINTFVNTVHGGTKSTTISDTINVDESFSFLNNQPYIYNATKGYEVRISRQGEDPHGIMIPYDFKYPLERVCIKDAYLDFNNWGAKLIEETDWYKHPEEIKVY